MQFLARDEARLLQKKLDSQIADKPRPKLVLYYESGNRDYSKAANTITASIGKFTEVTLLFLFCVTGVFLRSIPPCRSEGCATNC